jgi:hypothetical protein
MGESLNKKAARGDVRLCVRCAYDIRGLDRMASCPECGQRVQASFEWYDLQYTAPQWRARLRLGVRLIAVALAAVVGGWTLWSAWFLAEIIVRGEPAWAEVAARVLGYASLVGAPTGFVGFLCLAARDPGASGAREGRSARRVLLACTWVAGVAGGILLFGLALGGPAWLTPVFVVLVLALSGLSGASVFVLGRVLRRSAHAVRHRMGGTAVMVLLCDVLVPVYLGLLRANRAPARLGNWVATLFLVLLVLVPATGVAYFRLLLATARVLGREPFECWVRRWRRPNGGGHRV